jgi:hypothetical protein
MPPLPGKVALLRTRNWAYLGEPFSSFGGFTGTPAPVQFHIEE